MPHNCFCHDNLEFVLNYYTRRVTQIPHQINHLSLPQSFNHSRVARERQVGPSFFAITNKCVILIMAVMTFKQLEVSTLLSFQLDEDDKGFVFIFNQKAELLTEHLSAVIPLKDCSCTLLGKYCN